ncbi:MAG: alpha-glucan family phosphorylase [Gaiellaceae bacterium]
MSWWERTHGDPGFLVAYFSPEFGLSEALPIYSGGLGILAGDHLKSASDLGVPLVGVGLFYRQGYFEQSLEGDRQEARYPTLDPERLGLVLEPVVVEVELAGEPATARVWRADVGSVALYLLESEVTDVLYGGDREHRIRQEVLLGVGGVRALRGLGLEPSVFHMNEGHAAFLGLERARALVEARGLPFSEALELVRASTVFTTHTPVPAGNEQFDEDLARRYLDGLAQGCGVPTDEILALGRVEPTDPGFGMTPLALRISARANGVSADHGAVSRAMWRGLWPGLPTDEVPIGHVTNAVHAPTWLAPELAALLADAGVDPAAAPDEADWYGAASLDPVALWAAHRRAKARLFERLDGGRIGGERLDPNALTIGFARRFAPYKRADLLFSDLERLARLLSDVDRPVQIVFAGKAHPADEPGQELLARIVAYARDPRLRGRVAFVAGYDMALARLLVQGADMWLNNPRPPEEASGTSGMKAGLNGVLNLSVLDGWWSEGYAPELGWAIPATVSARGDEAEADELLRLLEDEVVPAFYERGADGVPVRWTRMQAASIADVGARFTGGRMVAEYVERLYL